jgi:TetR/AcrR family transcriptional repressor of nem operon
MRHFSEISPAAERVLDAAEALIQSHGYNGFSYDDIARQIGIKKPTIHHHFPTKSELVTIVAQRYAHRFRTRLTDIAGRPGSAADRLRAYAQLFAGTYRQNRKLCVCGMLGADAETLPADAAAEVTRFFRVNLDWLASVMADGERAGTLRLVAQPRDHAQAFLSALEGAMMVGRGLGSDTSPEAVGRTMISSLLA